MRNILEIRDLQVHYGGIEAVRGISLDVPEGEIVTLIGANGAGKSSTLRAIAGLVESALKAQGRRIIVVDDTELDDDLVRDVTEVLTSFCARLYGRRAAKRKTDAALKAARDA